MKKINIKRVADIVTIIGIVLIIFTFGRLYQQKKDVKMYKEYIDRYYDLYDEYQD